MILSTEDRYALARTLAGLPPDERVPMTPMVALVVQQWRGRVPTTEDVAKFREWFGQELIAQIFAVDPTGPAPVKSEQIDVPSLPMKAQLSAANKDAASTVGKWLDLWMEFAQRSAGMTDDLFLESGGLWLIGLACARRVRLSLDFQTIFNTHYVLWVAPTTYYRKSTGLRTIERLAREFMGHLLLAGQSSPEMLLHKLAGQRTTNYDELDEMERQREDAGRMFAGQRGFISDEMSKLFSKKYMEGLPEILMEMAEAPSLIEHEYKGMGKLVVKNAGLSLLFATTPSRLMRVFGDGEWEDGLLPRFALLVPSASVVKRTPAQRRGTKHLPSDMLVAGLRNLVTNLPQPKPYAMGDDPNAFAVAESVEAYIEDEALDGFNRYADALHDMTAPSSGLDYRLTGVYGRLPVHGLRVAMSLAAVDWAVAGDSKAEIRVTHAHWCRAQMIVETWRLSAHRMLSDVNRGPDQQNEEKIIKVLRLHYPTPPSKHDIFRRAGIGSRRDTYAAIDALAEAGVIMVTNLQGREGYQLVRDV